MKKCFNRWLLFFGCSIITISFCSWGFYVHETATQLAVYQLPKQLRQFFFSNIDSVVSNSIRPDQRRYTNKEEGPKHFIDIENYGEDVLNNMPKDWQSAITKYSIDTLKTYGYVPYEILIEDSLLTNAFRQKNADSIFFYAEDLAHYIEDANVPLHTTNNYDGQLTNQKGIHALWESTIPELEISCYCLYSKHKATYIKDKPAVVWNAIRTAHALLPQTFEKEKEVAGNYPGNSKYEELIKYGRKTKVYSNAFAKQYAAVLGVTINNQLISSANMVSDFWYTAWVDAGKPDLENLFQFNRKNEKQLSKEMKAYRKNDLVEDSLLRAEKK